MVRAIGGWFLGAAGHRVGDRRLVRAAINLTRLRLGSRPLSTLPSGVLALRTFLDSRVVGHEDTKECLLLGLVAREHVFIQGEPGTAKTHVAELCADATGLDHFCVQFHRDTRLQDLIGDAVIIREPNVDSTGEASGEVVRQGVLRGGLLTADIAVLDDITRAPGEALNVLLRLLNERTYEGDRIPLRVAIATANNPRDDMYVEPLDPANLDRFALQTRSDGLIFGRDWDSVKHVVELYANGASVPARATASAPGQSDAMSALVAEAASVALIEVDDVELDEEVPPHHHHTTAASTAPPPQNHPTSTAAPTTAPTAVPHRRRYSSIFSFFWNGSRTTPTSRRRTA